MNETQLTIVKEDEIIEPNFDRVVSTVDNCIRDCHNKSFHTVEVKCVYEINYTNTGKIEIFYLTTADKSMNLYELNKNLKITRSKMFFT